MNYQFNIDPQLNLNNKLILFDGSLDGQTYDLLNMSKKNPNKTLASKAKKLEILKFSTTDNLIFKYSHINVSKSYINVEKKWCSFSPMADKGICEHLVRVAIIVDFPLVGLETKTKLTVRSARLQKCAKKIDLSVSNDE